MRKTTRLMHGSTTSNDGPAQSGYCYNVRPLSPVGLMRMLLIGGVVDYGWVWGSEYLFESVASLK